MCEETKSRSGPHKALAMMLIIGGICMMMAADDGSLVNIFGALSLFGGFMWFVAARIIYDSY